MPSMSRDGAASFGSFRILALLSTFLVLAALLLVSQTSRGEPLHPAGSATSAPRAEGGATESAPAIPQTPEAHAHDLGVYRARALTEGILDRRLSALAERWRQSDEDARDALEQELDGVAPERLALALTRSMRYPTDAPRGRVAGRYLVGHRAMAFVAHIPEDYTPDRPWPMHIALHGGGGTPWKSCDYNWESGEPARHGVILVCPSADSAGWWLPSGEHSLMAMVEHMRRTWNIDTDRVSIGGASSGGFGTWNAVTRFPWLWSAAVVRCAATPRDPATLQNIGDLPAFLIHGDKDAQISVVNSRRSFELLQQNDQNAEYVEVAEMGHAFGQRYNPMILDWLQRKQRQLAERFTYRLIDRGAPQPARLHWLKPRWPQALAHPQEADLVGAITRADPADPDAVNLVELSSEVPLDGGTILLTGDLWTPGHPVRVLYNGEPVFDGAPTSSNHALLESWVDHRDPGLMTSWAVTFDTQRPPVAAK